VCKKVLTPLECSDGLQKVDRHQEISNKRNVFMERVRTGRGSDNFRAAAASAKCIDQKGMQP
jgi:hypothetical protein